MVLGFVGLKMITADYLPFPRVISLGIIVLILGPYDRAFHVEDEEWRGGRTAKISIAIAVRSL